VSKTVLSEISIGKFSKKKSVNKLFFLKFIGVIFARGVGWGIFSARQHAERAICYRPSVRLSVCLSVCLSVRHTGGSVKNG